MRKHLLPGLLALCLVIGLAGTGHAQAPAADSLNAVYESVRGNASFSAETYPEIWITPIFSEHILLAKEKYPPHFLRIAPPEATLPMEFNYDSAVFIDHDLLLVYSYYAYDRASFELFLEKAEPENTLSDGSDGVAMYVVPDSRRARAMIDISEHFDNTPKLEIIISDYTGDLDAEDLQALIEEETARVRDNMEFVALDDFWSADAYASVQLHARNDPYLVTVDTAGMTIVKLEENALNAQRADGNSVSKTKVIVEDYSYAAGKEGENATLTLADGTEWIVYNSDYTGYASRLLTDSGKYDRSLYLTIQIDAAPDAFAEALEAMAARVTVAEE